MVMTTVWRLPQVLQRTGLSRSTVYEMIARGDFPRQIQLGRRAVGWIADDIIDWIHARADTQSGDGLDGTARNVGTMSESINTSSQQSYSNS